MPDDKMAAMGSDCSDQPPKRRLSDLIITAFFRACSAGDLVTADFLLKAVESLSKREGELYAEDRRAAIDTLSTLRMHLLLTSTQSFEQPLNVGGTLPTN